MLDTPDTPQWRPNVPRIMEQASALRLEMQALRQRSLRLRQESRLLRFELDDQVRRSAEVIGAVEAVREQPPDLADWVLPDLLPREPAPREPARPAPVLPQAPLVLEITVRVLDRYNWEPISQSCRTRDNEPDGSERQSA
jgi:hypothetical protein